MSKRLLHIGLLVILLGATLGWGQSSAEETGKKKATVSSAKQAEEQWTIRMRVSSERAATLRRWLAQFRFEARIPSGTGPEATEGTPGGSPQPDCPGAEHGKYRTCWGPDKFGGGAGFAGEYLTDCMETQSSLAGGCTDGNCWQDACRRCGGSWQGNPNGSSGDCIAPPDDPFLCC